MLVRNKVWLVGLVLALALFGCSLPSALSRSMTQVPPPTPLPTATIAPPPTPAPTPVPQATDSWGRTGGGHFRL